MQSELEPHVQKLERGRRRQNTAQKKKLGIERGHVSVFILMSKNI